MSDDRPPSWRQQTERAAFDRGLTPKEAWRELPAGTVGYSTVAAHLAAERRRRSGASVQTVAGRLLALLSGELELIEGQSPPRDVERLQRLAQTLVTLQKLGPTEAADQTAPAILGLIGSDGADQS